jgi:hypothetical protein
VLAQVAAPGAREPGFPWPDTGPDTGP